VPPNFENGKVPEENRLETLPAIVDAQQKERHAARVRPRSVVRRWQTCSSLH